MAFVDTVAKEEMRCVYRGCTIKAGDHCWHDTSRKPINNSPTTVYVCNSCRKISAREQTRSVVQYLIFACIPAAFTFFSLDEPTVGLVIFAFIFFSFMFSLVGGAASEIIVDSVLPRLPEPPKNRDSPSKK